MDVSLDDYIRGSRNIDSKMDLSLDEYIQMNKIKSAQNQNQNQPDPLIPCVSKFDRYKHQDENDDDMEDESLPKEMPKLVPYEPKKMTKKPIHQRLGDRSSICESIHTSQMNLFRPNFKAKKSVQSRLGKNWVNPAVRERNRIAFHAFNTFAGNASNNAENILINDNNGKTLLNEFVKAIGCQVQPPLKKYNMEIQKEISSLQGKELFYTCPGAYVVSSDGPGLRGMVKVPTHKTDISLNQRFA